MNGFLRFAAWVGLIAICAVAAMIWWPLKPSPAATRLAADWLPDPGAGEYAMRAGDCAACHSVEGSPPFAGGHPIESPLGRIYSANITPDRESGIGGWSIDQFRAALIDGIGADGHHLYPAMPYENYRMLREEDIRALYDYFMTEVTPVRQYVPQPELPFPFNQRWGIRAFNWLALRHEPGFTPTMTEDPRLVRGEYLVVGPGHCAACHSPRSLYMAQDGIVSSDANYLTGGEIDGWRVPPLRGSGSAPDQWSEQELALYLATGRNGHSAANGEMALAIEHSLAHLSQEDVLAMAAYLKALNGHSPQWPEHVSPDAPLVLPPAEADQAGAATAALLTEAADLAAADLALGPRLYLDNCAACHFVTGKGSPQVFPELQGNSLVTAPLTAPLIEIILNGTSSPGTTLRPMDLVMQGYRDRLSDEEVAALASFIRQAWGNAASEVSAAEVSDIRRETANETAAEQGG